MNQIPGCFVFPSQFSHPRRWKKICRILCDVWNLAHLHITEPSPEYFAEALCTITWKVKNCSGLGLKLWQLTCSQFCIAARQYGNNNTHTGQVIYPHSGRVLCYRIWAHTVMSLHVTCTYTVLPVIDKNCTDLCSSFLIICLFIPL